MNSIDTLNNLARQIVRDACHHYFVDKNNEFIIQRCRDVDLPMIGFVDSTWSNTYIIISEHYYGTALAEDVCNVTARLALKDSYDDKEKEIIVDCSFICKRVSDIDIEFKSIHISYNDGKTAVMTKTDGNDENYKKAAGYMFDVVIEYDSFNNVIKYDADDYYKLFNVRTHFVSADQWFWHMCTESVIPEDTEKMDLFRQSDIDKRIRNHDNVITQQLRIKSKNDEIVWIEMTIILVADKSERHVQKLIILMKDINRLKKAELETLSRARKDSLSLLWNRYYTELLINDELDDVLRNDSLFAIIDIDRFKNVNDTFGHITGDNVISITADKLDKCVRKNDILGRIGGDEFVVFIKLCKDNDDAEQKIEELMAAIRYEYSEDDMSVSIHGSIGAVIVDKKYRKFEELYEKADKNLYKAKSSGRDTYVITD